MTTAHLDEDMFVRKLLVTNGGYAQLNCKFDNSIVTEWYFGGRRLLNITDK